MNLKESFRYQKFLGMLMQSACYSIKLKEHCLTVTKTHLRKSINDDLLDMEEIVKPDDFFPNDLVIKFMELLVSEREKLTKAINKAKASAGFDIDAAVETNKFRQAASSAIKGMLRHTSKSYIEQGNGYTFNVEGNQTKYVYDIEVTSEEAYDKDSAKACVRSMISEADRVSSDIDAAMVNVPVDYNPIFDVNESFEEAMEVFEKMDTSQNQ